MEHIPLVHARLCESRRKDRNHGAAILRAEARVPAQRSSWPRFWAWRQLFGRLAAQIAAGSEPEPRFVDLSLLVAADYPCTWPTFPPFQMNHYERIGPVSPYRSEILVIDGNTGTQLDVPPHSVTPPESGFSNAGEFGRAYTDVIPAWQFAGEACVIDCRDLRDNAPAGMSNLVKKERVIAWEKAHRPLGPGDVVLFYSGYSDAYYQKLPQGRRYAAEPLAKESPAWPDPDPECMDYLAESRGDEPGNRQRQHGALD